MQNADGGMQNELRRMGLIRRLNVECGVRNVKNFRRVGRVGRSGRVGRIGLSSAFGPEQSFPPGGIGAGITAHLGADEVVEMFAFEAAFFWRIATVV
jgi:hypothetical protein